MAMTNYPNGFSDGVSVRGVPVEIIPPNKVFFVQNTIGSDGNRGTKDRPFKTLDYAISRCTDSKGDIIFLLPGHAETITGAGGITLDKIGVHIIGMGSYDLRPAFLMDGANTVTALVTAADCTIENVVFRSGHLDIAVWGTVTAKGFRLINCAFEENIASENFKGGISVGSADNDSDGFEMQYCTWKGETAASAVVTLNKNQKDVRIVGNTITCDCSVTPYAPIYSPDTEIQLNILIADNIIHNLHDGNAAVGIAVANVASSGFIVRNLVGHQDNANETPILAGAAGLFVSQNFCSGVLGTASGYLYPAVDS